MSDEIGKTTDGLAGAFMRLSAVLFSEETLQSTLDLVCSLAQETITGAAGAGVTLVREGKRYTAAYSDEDVVARADELQYEMDEGPCLSSWNDKKTYRIDSMADESRWPRWSPAAAKLGIASSLSVPLLVREEALGAVKVYSREPHGFAARDESLLMMFARQAAIVLANVLGFSSAKEITTQLQQALENRDLIGMAKGIVMSEQGLDEEGAFERLRSLSQQRDVKLIELARGLVEKRTARAGD